MVRPTPKPTKHSDSFTAFLIEGEYLPRLPWEENYRCPECKTERGVYHTLGCKKEKSVCDDPEHTYFIRCDCPHREGEDV